MLSWHRWNLRALTVGPRTALSYHAAGRWHRAGVVATAGDPVVCTGRRHGRHDTAHHRQGL